MRDSVLWHEILHFASDVTGAALTERQVLAIESATAPIIKLKIKKVV